MVPNTRQIASLIHRVFTPEHLEHYAAIMASEAERLLARWTEKRGTLVDIHEDMIDATLLVIGRALFGEDLSPSARELATAVADMNDATNRWTHRSSARSSSCPCA